MDVAGAVGGDDHPRRGGGGEPPNLGHSHRVIRQDLQQERLELVVGPVDLIDQQHRGRAVGGGDGPQQGALDQEALGVQLVFEGIGGFLGGAAGGLRRAEVQKLAGVVPLVHRLGHVDAFVALEADQLGAGPGGQGLGRLGLAHAGLALQQQGAVEAHGQKDRRGQPFVGQVVAALQPIGHLSGRCGMGVGMQGLSAHSSSPRGQGAGEGPVAGL